jgi:hypothetical protein
MGFLKFWGKVREGVASWLRARKLEESVLMDAWVAVNKCVDAVTRVVKSALKRPASKVVSQTENVVREEQIDDPEVRARVRKLKAAEQPAAKKRRVNELVH